MNGFRDLFDQRQLDEIERAPLFSGSRHPSWYPLFYEKKDSIDFLVDEAVRAISQQEGGVIWLRDLISRLTNLNNVDDAASALAEIRAYGGLLRSGFEVRPIKRSDDHTPDFSIDAGDGEVIVEVFAKHQDGKESELQAAAHDLSQEPPDGVVRNTREYPQGKITTTIFEMTPGGKPDPTKPNDSVQANVISRICAIKKDEKQLPSDKPAVLLADFTNFGGRSTAQMLRPNGAAPIEKGHHGLCCGPFWYAMYGWKGAPLFEELRRNKITMGHDGRFRQKAKISAFLMVLPQSVVLLENPWAQNPLPTRARLSLCRYPWFRLEHSIANWSEGDAERQVQIHRRLIEAMDAAYHDFWQEMI